MCTHCLIAFIVLFVGVVFLMAGVCYCRIFVVVQAQFVIAKHLLPFYLPHVVNGIIQDRTKVIRQLSILSVEAKDIQLRIIHADVDSKDSSVVSTRHLQSKPFR